MNGIDFGPRSPGCIDCIDGHCTMNCSPRGRACHKTRHNEAEQPADETMTAIAQVLASSLPEIPITFSTPPSDRPHPLFKLLREAPSDATRRMEKTLGATFEIKRDATMIFESPSSEAGRLIPGAREMSIISGKSASLAMVDDLEWTPIPMGNLFQPGGTLNTSEDIGADESACWHREREERAQIADIAGLKIFADPRVPNGEVWMGLDLGTRPDIAGFMDEDGNVHILKRKEKP